MKNFLNTNSGSSISSKVHIEFQNCSAQKSHFINHPRGIWPQRCLEWEDKIEDIITCKTSQGRYHHHFHLFPAAIKVSRPWQWDSLGWRSSDPHPTRLGKVEPDLLWGESSHWSEHRVNSLDFKLNGQSDDETGGHGPVLRTRTGRRMRGRRGIKTKQKKDWKTLSSSLML